MSITLYHLMEKLWPKAGNPLVIFLSILLILFLSGVLKRYIMAQEKINYLQNTKEGLLSVDQGNIVSYREADTA